MMALTVKAVVNEAVDALSALVGVLLMISDGKCRKPS